MKMLLALLTLALAPFALAQTCPGSATPVPVYLDKFEGPKTKNLFNGMVLAHNLTYVSGQGKMLLSKPTGFPNYYMSRLTADTKTCYDSSSLLAFAMDVQVRYRAVSAASPV